MKLFTPFDFDVFSNKDQIDNSLKLEYIKQMIALAQEDKKSVYPYIAIGIGLITFMVNKFESRISDSDFIMKLLFYLGVIIIISSSILYFSYWRKIHKCQIQMTGCIPTLNIEKTRDLWINLWYDNKILYKLGLILLIIGCILVLSIPSILLIK